MTQTLTEIWHRRLQEARNTKKADKPAAENAVVNLYEAMGRAKPTIHWIDSPSNIKGAFVHRCVPLNGILDLVFLDAWHRLPEPEKLTRSLGYDAEENLFAMGANYDVAWRNVRLHEVVRRRQSPRPAWLRIMRNIITQLDSPQLSIWEYATEDSRICRIGQAISDVLHESFGVIMFTGTCLLIDRPRIIHFDDTYMLSSTTTPALEWRDKKSKIFCVNGILVSEPSIILIENYRKERGRQAEDRLWFHLAHSFRNPAERVATIEILGWEKFLDMAKTIASAWTRMLSKDKYGELWRVMCGNQTLVMVKVINKSAEPDGTFRPYVLPVDPRLRPIPNPRDPNGVMGKTQIESALNAVASTFGMTGEQYAELLVRES